MDSTLTSDETFERPLLCILIDEVINEGYFKVPNAPENWTSRTFDVGPVAGILQVDGMNLNFEFQLGRFSGKIGSLNLADTLAESIAGEGISFEVSLEPQPKATMKISIPSHPQVFSKLVAKTLMQVANAVIQSFRAAVDTGELIEPNAVDLKRFGLLKPRLLQRRNGSRNWNRDNAGALFLLGKI